MKVLVGRLILPIVMLACLMSSTSVYAQYSAYFSASKFLRATQVYHVVRDRKGFLWFCTNKGLVRYDGRTIQRFTREEGMADNEVFNLYEDRQGRIWPFCFNGSYCFIAKDSIHNEGNDSFIRSLPKQRSYIVSMAESSDSSLWFGFRSRTILKAKNRSQNTIEYHREDRNRLTAINDSIYFQEGVGTDFYNSHNDILVGVDSFGFHLYKNKKLWWQLQDFRFTFLTVNEVYVDADRRLIVATNDGLFIIDIFKKTTIHLLPGTRLTGVTQDISRSIWATTFDGGVYKFNRELGNIRTLDLPRNVQIYNVHQKLTFKNENTLNEIYSFNGRLVCKQLLADFPKEYTRLYASSKVILAYDTWSRRTKVFQKQGSTWEKYTLVVDNSYKGLFLKQVFSYDDSLFFAYGGCTQYQIIKRCGRLQVSDSTSLAHRVTAACQDGDKNVYFTSGASLFKYDFKLKRSIALYSAPFLNSATSLLCMGRDLIVANETTTLYKLSLISDSCYNSEISFNFPVNRIEPSGGDRVVLFSDQTDYLYAINATHADPLSIAYPFSATDYDYLTFLDRFCIARVDGQYYYYDSTLLRLRSFQGSLYLKKLIVNGMGYSGEEEIEIRNTTKVTVQLTVGILDFDNQIHRLKYRLFGEDTTAWQLTDAQRLEFVLDKPGAYALEVLPDQKEFGVKLSASPKLTDLKV